MVVFSFASLVQIFYVWKTIKAKAWLILKSIQREVVSILYCVYLVQLSSEKSIYAVAFGFKVHFL